MFSRKFEVSAFNLTNEEAKKDDNLSIRKKREMYTVEIRKNHREEEIVKRRFNRADDKETNLIWTIEDANEDVRKLRSFVDDCIYRRYTVDELQNCFENVCSGDLYKEHYGVIGLRKILAESEATPIQEVLDSGILGRLLEFLKNDGSPQLQLEATWVIANLATGNSYQTKQLVEKECIPILLRLLYSRYDKIIEQVAWALANIAGDNTYFRDEIITSGGLEVLCQLIHKTESEKLIPDLVWALSSLIRGKERPQYPYIKSAVPALAAVIMKDNLVRDNLPMVKNILWSMVNLTIGGDEVLTFFVQTQIIPRIIECLKSEDKAVLIPALKIIGNLLSGSAVHTNVTLRAGALQGLFAQLRNKSKSVRRECCWALSNVTAGQSYQVGKVVKHPKLVARLIKTAWKDVESVKREAIWVLSSIVRNGKPRHIETILKAGLLDIYAHFINSDDMRIVAVILEGCYYLCGQGEKHFKPNGENLVIVEMEKRGIIRKIEELQRHNSQDIYSKAVQVIDTFFEAEKIFE